MLDGVREQFASPVQIIASVQNPVDFRALFRSLLHLVEIAIVARSGLSVSLSDQSDIENPLPDRSAFQRPA
jgi:hypothetical protein